ncbi:MAG: 50S ribosomal protein L13 [Candidatus Kapaibacterium sp.]
MKTSGDITKSIRHEDVQRKWWVVDANGMTLGRLATQVAVLLRGKHKAIYTPHVDCGDYVVVINADKVQLQGKRAEQKEYFHYTGYMGGERFRSFKDLIKTKPDEVIELAVKGMLPKNSLGKKIGMKLKAYAGTEHPHGAQSPEPFQLPY